MSSVLSPKRHELGPQVAALVAILALGAILRFHGLWWGFPYQLHCDETKLIGVTLRLGQRIVEEHSLDPRFSAYGALPMYAALLGAPVARVLGSLAGHSYEPALSVQMAGRFLSATADVVSILLVFLIGRRWSAAAGLWGAALYATALVAVRESHFFSPDVLSTTFALLYLYCCSLLTTRSNRWQYVLAGLTLGLALSVKFATLPLVILGLIAYGRQVKAASQLGGDPRPFRMSASALKVKATLAVMGVGSLLPVALWTFSAQRIRAVAQEALGARVDEERLLHHTAEYWQAHVDGVYRGVADLLATVAVLGVGTALVLLSLAGGTRGLRMCHEAYVRRDLLAAFLGSVIATFVILNPYCILNAFEYWAPAGPTTLTWNLLMVAGAFHPPPSWMLHFEGTWPYLYQLVHVFPYGWGPPLTVCVLVGLVWASWTLWRRPWGPLWAATLAGLVLFLLLARLHMKMVRYTLPLTPVLCLLAGGMIAHWASRGGARTVCATACGAVVVACSLVWCLAYGAIYAGPDNRVEALGWLAQHVRPASLVVYERDDSWGAAGETALAEAGPFRVERMDPLYVMHDYVGQPLPEEAIRQTAQYLTAQVTGADYLVVTDINRDRIGHLAHAFPVMHEFYTRLFSGQTDFRQAAAFERGPSLLGRPIDDSGAELSFRLFDHPKVYIFQRERPASPSPLSSPTHGPAGRPRPVTPYTDDRPKMHP